MAGAWDERVAVAGGTGMERACDRRADDSHEKQVSPAPAASRRETRIGAVAMTVSAVMLGVALAFSVGGRIVARRVWERQVGLGEGERLSES